jgi:hypothetical protein
MRGLSLTDKLFNGIEFLHYLEKTLYSVKRENGAIFFEEKGAMEHHDLACDKHGGEKKTFFIKHEHEDECGKHDHTFYEELIHHLPYAIFSVAVGIVILSFLSAFQSITPSGYYLLFHSFHFLHILFAATGTIITFSRFSRNTTMALIVGIISPTFFCIFSDILMPYAVGRLLGVTMELHICFHHEIHNILPFLAAGVINGMLLRHHQSSMLRLFSIGSHFVHILISSLAALFYLVSHGFSSWHSQMGYIMLVMAVAIIVPCTLSDIVVPMYFAGIKKK